MHGVNCCEFPKKKCFACKRGKCIILKSSKFAGACPFFKSPANARSDLKRYGGIKVYRNGEIVQINILY